MTPVIVVGSAIALNVVVMAGGVFWAKRQVKRVAAERAAAYRAMFVLDPLPPPGAEVQILVDDEGGMLAELDAVHWPHLGWVDAIMLLKVEDDVVGWRWHPFRERPQEDPATWPRERLAAELERVFPSSPGDHERQLSAADHT